MRGDGHAAMAPRGFGVVVAGHWFIPSKILRRILCSHQKQGQCYLDRDNIVNRRRLRLEAL
jgi:hypothetical protein